jgi:hypothetical protein
MPTEVAMQFLVEGEAFAPGSVLQPGPLPLALEPEALSKFSKPRVSGVIRAVAVEAFAPGTVPMLGFADFAGWMSAPNGHFGPPLVRAH